MRVLDYWVCLWKHWKRNLECSVSGWKYCSGDYSFLVCGWDSLGDKELLDLSCGRTLGACAQFKCWYVSGSIDCFVMPVVLLVLWVYERGDWFFRCLSGGFVCVGV